MAIALDASTPAFAWGTSPVATASFTPPNDSLLVAVVTADWFGSTPTITCTSTGLTFTERASYGTDNQGVVKVFTAPVGSNGGTSRTVQTTTNLSANTLGLKVFVLTGADNSSPVDSTAGATGSTSDPYNPTLTVNSDGCFVCGGAVDWNGTGVPTSTDSYQSNSTDGTLSGITTWKASLVNTGTATFNFNAVSTPMWSWAGISIKAAPSGPQPQAIPVSFVAVGAYSTSGSTAPLSIPVPAGLQEGDLAVAVITSKAASTTFISSSGWVQAYQSPVLGGGTVGTGTGPVYVTIMTRVVPAGGLTGPVSFSFNATPNSYVGVMFGLRYDATGMTSPSWNATSLTGTSYSRTTASTTFGGTGAANLGLATYDWVVFASASADDQSSNHSSSGVPAISATGATLTGTTTRSGTGVTTTGGDCSQWVGTASVTAGASTAAPVMSNLTANSSETGGGVFVKIRATALPGTTPVAASRSTSWAVAQQVASSRATTWNVLENLIAVASSRATSWRVLRAETSSRATTWRTASTVTGSRATSWRTLAQVQAARASSWAVLVAVAASRATTWRTLAEVAASRATSWAVQGLAAVASSRATTWAVRAATSAARSTTWTVRTPASSSRATTWSTRSVVEASRQTTWRVLSQVSGSRSTTWTTRSVVSAVRSTSWRVLRVVTASRSTLWAVAGELVSVAASRSTTWAVQAYAQVAASRATSWATRSAVAPASRSTSWAVLSSRLAARSTSWRVSEQVSSSRPTSWETRAQVAASRLALWETLEAVTTSRSTSWAVVEPAFAGGHIEAGLAFPVQAALSGIIHAAIGGGGLTATLGAAPHAGLNLSQIVE